MRVLANQPPELARIFGFGTDGAPLHGVGHYGGDGSSDEDDE